MTALGQMFYQEVMAPKQVMAMCSQRGDIAGAIDAVHFTRLATAFHAGVARVAAEAEVTREQVFLLLPDKEMGAAGDATVASQQQMVKVWQQHTGTVGNLLNIAGRAIDAKFLGGFGIGDLISSFGNKFFQDARLKEANEEFHQAFATYDQWVRWAVDAIDGDGALQQSHARALQRRSRVSLIKTCVFVAVVGGGLFFALHEVRSLVGSNLVDAGSPPPPPPVSPLTGLTGAWTDDAGATFDAVLVGDEVEFRVHDAAKFPRHGVRTGDVRFALSKTKSGDEGVFAVEDHVRPAAPKGLDYNLKSEVEGCVEEWNDVGGVPLRARLDASQLSVDIAKIDVPASAFTIVGGKVVGCNSLTAAHSARSSLKLTRQ